MKTLMAAILLTLSFASQASVDCSIGKNAGAGNNSGATKVTLEEYSSGEYISNEGSKVNITILGNDTANIQLTTKEGTHAMAFGQMTNSLVTLTLNNEKVFCVVK